MAEPNHFIWGEGDEMEVTIEQPSDPIQDEIDRIDALLREAGEDPDLIGDAGPASLYVSRRVLNAADILRWARAQGYADLPAAEDLHVTICYSTKPVDWMEMGQPWDETIEIPAGGPRMVDTFGEGAEVLLFASSSLKWRHEEFLQEGASWDHAGYQPHITLTYSARESESPVQPYTGKIVLGPEIFEEIKTDAV